MSAYELPHDHNAEEAVIGAALISDVALEAAAYVIDDGDFDKPAHKNIWQAILQTYAAGKVDQITVAAQLTANGYTGDGYDIAALSKFLIATPSVTNAERYAHIIAEMAVRRRVLSTCTTTMEDAWNNTDAAAVAERARDRFADIDVPAGKPVPDQDFVSFMGEHLTEYDWLIPGVLEHRDRLLVTAGEGAGKSMLLAQIGFMTAAGLHCWTHKPIQPRNVAIIDLENSPRMLSRRMGMLRAAAIEARVEIDPQRLRVRARPEGLDLTGRTDRRWLIDRCLANSTELLVIGPAYRMSAGVAAKGDVGGEDHARTVTKALDEIRNRCNVTLVMETHAPHGNNYGRDLRPFGSSVWLRWPEFGIGIRKDGETGNYAVEHWRGPRDKRDWPQTLVRGRRWPWTAIMPQQGTVAA